MEKETPANQDLIDLGLELQLNEIYNCNSTSQIVEFLDKTLKINKTSLNLQQMRDCLLRASAKANCFDDYRNLYLFSFFSVYPKIWPDFKWVDSLMETTINYVKTDSQLILLYKDATLMGRNLLINKLRSIIEFSKAKAMENK